MEVGRETVLIVDDEPLVGKTLGRQLADDGYRTQSVESLADFRERLNEPPPSLVLLDLRLPDGDGLEILPTIRTHWPDVPVIVMTGHGSVSTAVDAMLRGAVNYVQKPLNFDELRVTIRQALDTSHLVQRVFDEQRRNADRFSFARIVAESLPMQRTIHESRTAAASPASTVLLLGESGTGKGLVASAVHYASDRADQRFLKVLCSAIPETLLEAEMFGHEKGAFTDAKRLRRGVFESAHRGTVFLDEIGDMPLSLQAKLLGIIDDRSFCRIGGTERVEVDVRIIAATHRDIERAVDEGRFREDLYYRLRVVPIILPALRDRPEDILPLAESFLAQFNREFGRKVEGFDEGAMQYLRAHAWPGNVRELQNVIERAMLFSSQETLKETDLLLDMGYRPRLSGARAESSRTFVLPSDGIMLASLEQDLVRQAIRRSDGNQSRAAALLGISRDQIRYRLDKMGALPRKNG